MDDMDRLREFLDDEPPSDAAREQALAELRRRMAAAPRRSAGLKPLRIGGIAAALLLAVAIFTLRSPPAVEAWSPEPVIPPDPVLVERSQDLCGEDETADVVLVDQRDRLALVLLTYRADSGNDIVWSCTFVREDEWVLTDESDLPFAIESMHGEVDEEALGGAVTKVVIPGGDYDIEVTYADGFFLVWWPNDLSLVGHAIEFVALDGTVLMEIPIEPVASSQR